MSVDNIYEYAQDFEEKYMSVNKQIESVDQGASTLSALDDAKNILGDLDYLLNQMVIERSLMSEEDQGEVNIVDTCKEHLTSARKRVSKIETEGPAKQRKRKVDEEKPKEKDTKQKISKKTIDFPNLDSSNGSTLLEDSAGSLTDLRQKYGVQIDLKNDGLEYDEYRMRQERKKKLMAASSVVVGIVLIYGLFKLLF